MRDVQLMTESELLEFLREQSSIHANLIREGKFYTQAFNDCKEYITAIQVELTKRQSIKLAS